MTDLDLQVRVPRFPAAAALTAALASAVVAACSGTGPLAPAGLSAQATAATTTTPAAAASRAAATPGAQPSATRTPCVEQQAALADAKRAVDTARERKANAWKLVIPFAVLARHAQAGNELEAAEKQLAALQAQAAREGCGDGR